MDVIGPLQRVLARAIGRDVRHRPGPVERDQRDDVLEAVGPHVEQRPAHALAFHLEHADRLAARQLLVAFGVVERQVGKIDVDAAAAHQLCGDVEHRERLQAQEVELHQARGLDPFHVELGHLHVGFRIAVERHQFRQRRSPMTMPAACVEAWRCKPSSRCAMSKARCTTTSRSRSACSRGSVSMALFSVIGRRILRHELAQLVDLAVGHLQHAADVAQHAARLQGAERDDLRHLLAAVFLLDVAMTSSRRSWQKSTSKSGIETRSGLRKRSNRRPKRSGSRSVMVSA